MAFPNPSTFDPVDQSHLRIEEEKNLLQVKKGVGNKINQRSFGASKDLDGFKKNVSKMEFLKLGTFDYYQEKKRKELEMKLIAFQRSSGAFKDLDSFEENVQKMEFLRPSTCLIFCKRKPFRTGEFLTLLELRSIFVYLAIFSVFV